MTSNKLNGLIVIAIAVRFIPKIPHVLNNGKARFQAVFDTVICGLTCYDLCTERSLLPLPMTNPFVTFTSGFSSGITQWTFPGHGTTVINNMLLCMYVNVHYKTS